MPNASPLLTLAALLVLAPAAAFAADAPPASAAAAPTDTSGDIVITAKRLNDARASIQPSLGATTYTITNAQIQALPGGDNQQLNQILLQLPGVVQDGFGQFHVRDDHNNLQYRINGTILPEGVAVFGQTLSPRLVERFDLRTGALPAQYGLRTAGIVDITTKSGFQNGGKISIYGGSHDTIEPSIEYGGSTGSTNYFVTGSYRRSNLGIEAVDAGRTALHDKTGQYQGFVYLDHIIDPNNRVSLIGGYADQTFQIPDPRGLQPDGTYTINGSSAFPSENINENQHEQTAFTIVSLLHNVGIATVQASVYARYSRLQYSPDVIGELLFNGSAQAAVKQDFTVGGQIEGVFRVTARHTLRAGVIVSRDRSISRTTTQVFPVDANGNQSGNFFGVPDNGAATEWTYTGYLQDEWKLFDGFTVNYGGRFDRYEGFRSEQQFSPRINTVWTPGSGTTVHAGYARYFSPAPFANVASATIAKFVGTSAAPANGTTGTIPLAERQDYFDVGVQQKLGRVTLGIDGYHRVSRNLIDEGQFGAPIILTPYNYERGRIDGVEGDVSYSHGPLLVYANFSYAKAKGTNIVSSQFNFNPDDFAYLRHNFIYLDHDQTYTGSGGVTYRFGATPGSGPSVGISMLYGSGLRRRPATPDANGVFVPNGAHLPGYAVFNLTASHKFVGPGLEIRADIANVADHVYEIRDGSGVGVGAPQFGQRRGFFVGITKDF